MYLITIIYSKIVNYLLSLKIHQDLANIGYKIDLKKAAKVANEKNVTMINVNDINKFTGYIRGGCSPIGMKKLYKTFVNESVKELSTMIVSAGKIGYQVELSPVDLQELINCEFKDIIK